MPTTFVGLLIFVAFLTPGFLYTAQRRLLAPQAARSALMEMTSVVSVSLGTNAVVGAVFGLIRWALPTRTPDLGLIIQQRSPYWVEHLPYVMAWATSLLVLSCLLAVASARSRRVPELLTKRFPPVIFESSAWCATLAADPGSFVHAGLELSDGGFVSGRVVWFSTDLEETGDRDLVLGPPLLIRTEDGATDPGAQRVIVAARDIRRIDVSYITDVNQPSDLELMPSVREVDTDVTAAQSRTPTHGQIDGVLRAAMEPDAPRWEL